MVNAGDIIGGGFRLLRERIGAVAVWALVYLAMTVATTFAVRPFMLNMVRMQTAAAAGTPVDPAAVMGGFGTVFGVYMLMLIGLVVLYTAGLRAAMRPQDAAFAYLRLGMDELRMLAVGMILGIGFIVLYLALSVAVGLVAGMVGFIAHGALIPLILVLVIAVFCVMVFFQVRFSMAFALTMRRGRIVIGESWRVTRGRFWTLFGAYLVLGLIVFASAMALVAITYGPYFNDIAAARMNPAAMQAAQQHQLERQFGAIGVLTVIGWVLAAALGAFWIALGAGAAGAAADGLLNDDFADIAAVYE